MVMYVYDQILYFEEQGIRPIIRGLFWMQGEADSCNLNMTNNYAANLNRFVESFREQYEEEYGVPGKGIAFVDAGISDSSDWPYYELINQIKKDFADSNPSKNYYFGTIEENLEYHLEGKKSDGSTDTYHYDATSELELGKLFISTLIDAGWL